MRPGVIIAQRGGGEPSLSLIALAVARIVALTVALTEAQAVALTVH